jgi:hypothetical protein
VRIILKSISKRQGVDWIQLARYNGVQLRDCMNTLMNISVT